MQFSIITPEKVVLDEDIQEAIVTTAAGEIAILPHHIDLLTQVIPGELIVKKNNKQEYLAVTGGFLEVKQNKVILLADYAVPAAEINAEKALAAQKRAEDVLKQKRENMSEKDFALAQGDLRRSLLLLKVARRRHHA